MAQSRKIKDEATDALARLNRFGDIFELPVTAHETLEGLVLQLMTKVKISESTYGDILAELESPGTYTIDIR